MPIIVLVLQAKESKMPRGDIMKVSNLTEGNRKIIEEGGSFAVVEYTKDASVSPQDAVQEFFMSAMNVRRRQLMFKLGPAVTLQAGALQWSVGDVAMSSGVGGAKGLLKGIARTFSTGESLTLPVYSGEGLVVCEPTYKYLLIEDMKKWPGGMVIEDGMFYAHDENCFSKIVTQRHFSAIVAGNETYMNLCISGDGYAVLESNVPREELIAVDLDEGDTLRIDGSFAVCWSNSLEFTVERSSSTLVGSAMSGEGLVNVYRGKGRVLLAPVTRSDSLYDATSDTKANVNQPINFDDIVKFGNKL